MIDKNEELYIILKFGSMSNFTQACSDQIFGFDPKNGPEVSEDDYALYNKILNSIVNFLPKEIPLDKDDNIKYNTRYKFHTEVKR